MVALCLFLLFACGAPEVQSSPQPPSEPIAVQPTRPVDAPALYAACGGRVEQPEVDGECEEDSECVAAGCSREVCVSATTGADLMTSCDVLDCLPVLDACTCQEGRCRWTLKGEL